MVDINGFFEIGIVFDARTGDKIHRPVVHQQGIYALVGGAIARAQGVQPGWAEII